MGEPSFDDDAPLQEEWDAALAVCAKYHVALESEQELAAFTHDLLVAARRARFNLA